MDFPLPKFTTNTLRIVCTSDTHNDNPSPHIPSGDIFIHAGDIVNRGSGIIGYRAALEWISALPHTLKIVIGGNGDAELDRQGKKFDAEILDLFISDDAKRKGIIYLDRETVTVGYLRDDKGKERPLRIYGNPLQPEFSENKYPFTYHPHPHSEADEAWSTTPSREAEAQIWVMHGPPLHRLDTTPIEGFTGCAVQAAKIAQMKPPLCVFGHFHYSWGVERVRWADDDEVIVRSETLALSRERRRAEGQVVDESEPWIKQVEFDFSGGGGLERGRETLFVNAAWMTTKKRQIEERNMPIVLRVAL